MSEQIVVTQVISSERKAYIKPAITHELRLETRAGSPLPTSIPPLIDPLGVDPTSPRSPGPR